MSDRKLKLKDVEQVLVKQYKECAEFKFFNEFKTHELRTEEIPDLIELIELIHRHEKDLAKNRQEIEIRILNHRMNKLLPNNK